MGPHLTSRVSELDLAWDKELTSHPASELSPYLPLDLDHHGVLRAIQAFNFISMKREYRSEGHTGLQLHQHEA